MVTMLPVVAMCYLCFLNKLHKLYRNPLRHASSWATIRVAAVMPASSSPLNGRPTGTNGIREGVANGSHDPREGQARRYGYGNDTAKVRAHEG